VIYRTTALVLAESFGRKRGAPPLGDDGTAAGGERP